MTEEEKGRRGEGEKGRRGGILLCNGLIIVEYPKEVSLKNS